jgi:hypothetical protein
VGKDFEGMEADGTKRPCLPDLQRQGSLVRRRTPIGCSMPLTVAAAMAVCKNRKSSHLSAQ